MLFADCEKKSIALKIENEFQLAYPSVKHALYSPKATFEIRLIQNRLLTYKELILHENILDKLELEQTFATLKRPERKLARNGVKDLTIAINQIDQLLERYQPHLPLAKATQ